MKVFFDMDAVLADFDRGVNEMCHMKTPNQEMEYNDETKDEYEAKDEAMWAAIRNTDHFYDRLEPMPGALEMFAYAYGRLGRENCQILSAIPKPKHGVVTAREDKINWCHRLLGPDVKVNIVYKEQKKDYITGADCVLVDDLFRNIKEWIQYGGTGILHKDAETSMKQLKNWLEYTEKNRT